METETTKQQIRNFIRDNFLFADTSTLGDSDSFLDGGIIDSTGILELIAFIGKTYDIAVTDEEMIPDNLDSVNKVAAYVASKRQSLGE